MDKAQTKAESAVMRAEINQLNEQLCAARLQIEAAQDRLQDLKQSLQAVQLQAYNDGFAAGMAVAMQNVMVVSEMAVAARDQHIAELQVQLTTAGTAAATQIAELQVQLTTAGTAAATQIAELQAQLTQVTARAEETEVEQERLEDRLERAKMLPAGLLVLFLFSLLCFFYPSLSSLLTLVAGPVLVPC